MLTSGVRNKAKLLCNKVLERNFAICGVHPKYSDAEKCLCIFKNICYNVVNMELGLLFVIFRRVEVLSLCGSGLLC